MNLPQHKIDELVEYLTGTTNSVEQGMELCGIEIGDEEEVRDRIVEYIFLCEGCGWWDSVDDLHDDTGEELCSDCVEGE